MHTTTIALKYPVKRDDNTTLAQISIRRATVADVERISAIEGTDATKGIHALANLADLTPDEVRRLDFADFSKASAAVARFLSPDET